MGLTFNTLPHLKKMFWKQISVVFLLQDKNARKQNVPHKTEEPLSAVQPAHRIRKNNKSLVLKQLSWSCHTATDNWVPKYPESDGTES